MQQKHQYLASTFSCALFHLRHNALTVAHTDCVGGFINVRATLSSGETVLETHDKYSRKADGRGV